MEHSTRQQGVTTKQVVKFLENQKFNRVSDQILEKKIKNKRLVVVHDIFGVYALPSLKLNELCTHAYEKIGKEIKKADTAILFVEIFHPEETKNYLCMVICRRGLWHF